MSDTGEAAAFYDRWSATFLDIYGPTFQAGLLVDEGEDREDPDASTLRLARRAGIEDGQTILDVGCGVGGPAIAIARAFDVRVEGVTVSPVQVELGTRLVAEAGLAGRIRLHLADMHRVPFPAGHFDRVLGFEVLCYSLDLRGLFTELHRVTRVQGIVYMKDIFVEEGPLSEEARAGMAAYEERWACMRTPTLGETVRAMRSSGLAEVTFGELGGIGTDRFYAGMLEQGSLALNEVGRHFLQPLAEFPIVWAEVRGRRP